VTDESPDWILRRTIDYQFVNHIAHLETRVVELETVDQRMNDEMKELQGLVREMAGSIQKMADHQPTLQSIERILSAGMVLRWIVLFTVGTLAAVGTVATAWDTIRGWVR